MYVLYIVGVFNRYEVIYICMFCIQLGFNRYE